MLEGSIEQIVGLIVDNLVLKLGSPILFYFFIRTSTPKNYCKRGFGICVFYSILADPTDSDEEIGRVVVISSCVEWRGRTHEEIRDMAEARSEPCISAKDLELFGLSPTVSLTVKEKVAYLEVAFVVPRTSQPSDCLLPPCEVVERALSKRIRVGCVRNNVSNGRPRMPNRQVTRGLSTSN